MFLAYGGSASGGKSGWRYQTTIVMIPEHFPNLEQQEARLERALAVFGQKDQERIRTAFAFAKRAHEGQFREGASRIPYVIHPIRVACTLVDEFGLRDADACVAALLHDVVEDAHVSIEDIEQRFSRSVRSYVMALTWQKGKGAKWPQASAMLRQPRVVRLIKASDIIDNTRAMWEVNNRARILKWIYGYAHWGRRIVQSVGAPATIMFEAALAKSTTIHFANNSETPLAPNAGKNLDIEIPNFSTKGGCASGAKSKIQNVARYPIHTHIIAAQDNLVDVIQKYAVPHLRPDDLLAISERIVAITQGRAFAIGDIHPSRWAEFLVRFVHKSPYGIGLGSPWTMEIAIREVGLPRILFAAVVSAATKPFGIRGMFYRVVGKHINAIDGPCDYTIPLASGECYAKLGPKNPDGVATQLAREIGADVAIIDANDLGVNVLGASGGVDRAFVQQAFRDNPLGQSAEQTPMAIVRRPTPDP